MKLNELMEAQGLSPEEVKSAVKCTQDSQKKSHEQLVSRYADKSFREVLDTKPESGTVLLPMKGDVVEIQVDWKKNQSTPDGELMEVRMCKAAVDDEGTGWYLTTDRGITCLISMHYFDRVFKMEGKYYVTALEVLRVSNTGRALVCKAI